MDSICLPTNRRIQKPIGTKKNRLCAVNMRRACGRQWVSPLNIKILQLKCVIHHHPFSFPVPRVFFTAHLLCVFIFDSSSGFGEHRGTNRVDACRRLARRCPKKKRGMHLTCDIGRYNREGERRQRKSNSNDKENIYRG